jgi:AcrR family transcriptional regulator
MSITHGTYECQLRYAATMTGTATPTIADAKRQATMDVVLVSARQLLLARGLDVTMDDIAEAAGVSRRTLFRHFESRERLIAESLEAGIQLYGELLPTFEGGWNAWLRGICDAAHEMQAGYGPGYWELTSRTDLPAEIAAVEGRRRRRRHNAMARIAGKLWLEAGGDGDPPAMVVATVGAHLSARFTAAVLQDVGQSWSTAADLAYAAIADVLDRECGERSTRVPLA